jgi:hypothetical protein
MKEDRIQNKVLNVTIKGKNPQCDGGVGGFTRFSNA